MKNIIGTISFLPLLVLGGADITAKQFRQQETNAVRIENSYYEIVVVPDSGGRIFYWKNKKSGVENVNIKIPDSRNEKLYFDGMLDDRGEFWNSPYEFYLEQPDENTVVLLLNCTDPGRKFTVIKKLIFQADSPVIRLEYRYENRSDVNISGFDIGVRNFVYPAGGGGITKRDRYIFPSTHGIRRIIGYEKREESGRPMPELGSKLARSIGAPWHALLNIDNQSGIAVSHEDNYYGGWYVWKSEVEHSTYEWTFCDLPAGHSRRTVTNLIQLDRVSGLCFASPDILVIGKPELDGKKLKYHLAVRPLTVPGGKYELRLSLRNVTGIWTAPPVKQSFEAALYKDTPLPLEFELPADGLYEIQAEVLDGKKHVAGWVESIPSGDKINTLPLYEIKYRGGTENTLIPGWCAPPMPVLQAADKECAFAACRPLTENTYRELDRLDLDLAANEFESCEIVVVPNRSKSGISARLTGIPAGLPVQLRYQEMVRIDGADSGLDARYGRILRPGNRVSGEEPNSFWLTVGGGKVEPGRYSFHIDLINTAGDEVRIPVTVNVRAFSLPRRPLVSLEAEGSLFSFPGTRQPEILAAWIDNQASHGIDFIQDAGKPRNWNYKLLDYYFDRAMDKGLVRYKDSRYDISPPKPGEEQRWRDLAAYLYAKGFQKRDLFVKILDEQTVDKFPAMAKTGAWLRECGFRPFSTFHLLMGKPEQLKILKPSFEMFQGGFTNRADYAARLKEGLIQPDDILLDYTGWGTCYQLYAAMLHPGFKTAALELPMFHNHEYMRGGNRRLVANIIMVDENDRPLDSAAFEGLRDGMDFANLCALYRQWRKLLASDASVMPLPAELDREYASLFEGADAICPIRETIAYGMKLDSVSPVSLEQYQAARQKIFSILDRLCQARNQYGLKFAAVRWNGKTIWQNGLALRLGGEADAVEYFREKLSSHTGLDAAILQNGSPGIPIQFEQTESPYSYMIVEEPQKITVKAGTLENLKLGISNWINTMDIEGIWR